MVGARRWQNSAWKAEQIQEHLQAHTFRNNQMPQNTWTRWTGQKIASGSQEDEDLETQFWCFCHCDHRWAWRLVKPNAPSSGAVSSKRKRGYREEAILLFATFQALICVGEGRSLRTTFSMLPCPLACGCFTSGRLGMGSWTARGKKRTIFPSTIWRCLPQWAQQQMVSSATSVVAATCGRGGVHEASWPLVNTPFFLSFPGVLWPSPCLKCIQWCPWPVGNRYRSRSRKSEVFSSKQRSLIKGRIPYGGELAVLKRAQG